MSFKSQKEMMECVIQEKPVRHKSWSEKSYVKMKDGFTYNEESFRVDLSFSAPQDFEIYEEPKQPRKMLAYVTEEGLLLHALEGSEKHDYYETYKSVYTRVEGFDLIEKLGGEV